jgi:deoxycytidylate deaminase
MRSSARGLGLPAGQATTTTATGPELVVGILSLLGESNRPTVKALTDAFRTVGYETREVSAIELVYKLLGQSEAALPRHELYHARMTKGNEFRRQIGRNDAIALASIAAIRDYRERETGDSRRPIPRCAYLVRSLKTREEVETLRRIYGAHFLVVASYASRARRRLSLAEHLLTDLSGDSLRAELEAERLIARDEGERENPHGQDLGDAFHLADVFVDATNPGAELRRFIELLFGHPFLTPTRAELAMFLAFGSAMRSAARRQVGVAIATQDGEVVALGTNEVARARGGQYWEGDEDDGRDHRRATNVTDTLMTAILGDLIARLKKKMWLSEAKGRDDLDTLTKAAQVDLARPCAVSEEDPPSLREEASIYGLIEFMRPVHAEMAAISSAARRGVRIDGCVIYTTTFPCHECARHLVASGLKRVVFIEPYPKSRVSIMFDDSIIVDGDDGKRIPFVPYIGLAPSIYLQVFRAPQRKSADGTTIDWDAVRITRTPRTVPSGDYGYIQQEDDSMATFLELLKAHVPH